MRFLKLAFFGPSLMLAGCVTAHKEANSLSAHDDPKAEQKRLYSMLAGDWRSECRNKTFSVMGFKDGMLVDSTLFFAADGCQSSQMMISIGGNYAVLGVAKEKANTLEILVRYEWVAVTPSSQVTVNNLNADKACGISTWKEGQVQVIENDMPNCSFKDALTPYQRRAPNGLKEYVELSPKVLNLYEAIDGTVTASFIKE